MHFIGRWHNAVVCWFGEYRPSTLLKCILIKYLFFTNKSMQYVRHTLLVVATHCDCSIGRHQDGVVCHYNMNYFNIWMRNAYPHTRGWRRNYCLCFHADIASKTADEYFKINVSCRCQITKINYVCVITIKWNICDMHCPLIIGIGGGVAQNRT